MLTTKQSKQYIIIMAGGSGTRMKSNLPKQLLDVGDIPMIVHIFNHCNTLYKDILLILSSKNKNIIIDTLVNRDFIMKIEDTIYSYYNIKIHIIIQPIANGTGGAILSTKSYFNNCNPDDTCLILSADVPLITEHTIKMLLTNIDNNKTDVVILGKDTKDNHGYGRIVMEDDKFIDIVEHRDCTEEQKNITLINTGIYAFKINKLLESLEQINNNNSQNEYYLTDCPKIINKNKNSIIKMLQTNDYKFDETLGANTPEQLQTLKEEYLKKFSIENIGSNIGNLTDDNLHQLVNVLEQLTDVDINDIKEIREHIANIDKNTHIYVVKYEDKIIGTGTVLIEDKIIHNFGKVAHIEDVVIDRKYRGNGLATQLINKLIDISKDHTRCYKITLDASTDVRPFYEKIGFRHHSHSMRMDTNI
jgi:bifunctional N-acetylglucosamine-1-phosphate-uridyltransferase/glucosamine-1-phosphate-acetyltransferase GlmU-like protein